MKRWSHLDKNITKNSENKLSCRTFVKRFEINHISNRTLYYRTSKKYIINIEGCKSPITDSRIRKTGGALDLGKFFKQSLEIQPKNS